MEKIKIVYIGNKPTKKDTVTTSRLVFVRHKPVEVDAELAGRLLSFPDVWVEADKLKDVLARKAEQEKIDAEFAEAERLKAEAEARAQDQTVIVEGETIDLAKYSSRQLDTLVLAHDLVINAPKKPVEGFRQAVVAEMRAKYESADGQE